MQAGRKELIEDRLWGLGEDALAISADLGELMAQMRRGSEAEKERADVGVQLALVLAGAARSALKDVGYPHLAVEGSIRQMVAAHRKHRADRAGLAARTA